MIDVNDLRKGVTFEFDDKLYKVLDYHHNKPGRGNATIRIKAQDLRTGTTLEKNFQSGERVQGHIVISVIIFLRRAHDCLCSTLNNFRQNFHANFFST